VSVGSEFELYGFLMANSLEVAAGTRFHFDSGIAGAGRSIPPPRLVGWRIEEIPASVRQTRVDPFRLYGLQRHEAESPEGARTSACWIVKVTHWRGFKMEDSYVGPLHTYVPPPDFTGWVCSKWDFQKPPDGSPEWFVFCRYRSMFGTEQTYDGPVADWPGFTATEVLELRVWPDEGSL
jgi:hypothetical protein